MEHKKQKSSTNTTILKKDHLEREKLALLGIQGSKEETSSSCPTSEEMANVILKNSSLEEEKELGQHIANCETCFREWITLSQLIGTMDKTTSRRNSSSFFLTPGRLTAIGSGLAIAASIILFFAINPQQLEQVKVLKSEQPERRLEAAPPAQPAELKPQAMDLAEGEVLQESGVEKKSPVPGSRAFQAAPDGVATRNFSMQSQQVVNYTTFKNYVLSYCQSSRTEPTFIDFLRRQANIVLNSPGSLSDEELTKVNNMIGVLEKGNTENKEATCKSIQKILQGDS